jgi:hypothetical protein
MNRPATLILVAAAALCAPWPVRAQWLKPIEPRKQAEIDGTSIELKDAELKSLTEPARDLPQRRLPNSELDLKRADTRDLQLKSLDFSTLPVRQLPQVNFTAKHAAAERQLRHDTRKEIPAPKAPLPDREIRAFSPAGEEELKKQLNEQR